LVVGCESGDLLLLDSHGETVKSAALGSSVTALAAAPASWPADPVVLAGTDAGKLAALAP
jgi:hypothetical protein